MAHLIYSVLSNPRREVVSVDSQTSVSKCVAIMTEKDIGALVVRDGDKIIGIVSEREVLRSCLFKKLPVTKTKAEDIAYKDVSVLSINDPIEKAMEIITKTKRRHVLVMDKGQLVAVLSIGDVLYHLLEDKKRVIEHLENYIRT
ncbi:CBS domain-containing protein [Legionella spiritensis]|uniref:CBS domain-containing protein n=1 Tax=Legionella spiritensis TaxID=452 RepID=UPI000F70C226|nr:CBS domain-containing protein [Legionella spiritensis]VEG89644.1 putative manganese-dependent inorganic pyrophosphatase [Legionella spiritensis]